MFIIISRQPCWLNGLLLLALLSQLLNGCPSQVLPLWCLELPQPCCRTVVRHRRRPLCEAPFDSQLAWLIHWLGRTWPHWLVRCGLLLALLLWRRAACPSLAWGLLVVPLAEVFCLGLGLLCRSSCWRRRWWGLAHWLGWGYAWGILLLLVINPSAKPVAPLLLGLLTSNHQESPEACQPGVETAEGVRLFWLIPCQATVLTDKPLFPGWAGVDSLLVVRDEKALRLLVQGLPLLEVPNSDRTGQRWLVQQLVRQRRLSLAEAADLLGLSLRTMQRDQAAYEQQQDSACLVDLRRFNLGQRTAYRVTEHLEKLISQWVLNLLTDQPNNGRRLEAQLGGVFDDRTIDRALERLGLSAAEAAGLRQRVQDFLEAVRQAAYWQGVEQRPLEKVVLILPDEGWGQQVTGRATLSLAILHLVGNGVYEAACGLLAKRERLISAARAWHTLLIYLLVSGGARLSQAKHLEWTPLRGLLAGRLVGISASFLRQWMTELAEKAGEEVTVQRSADREEKITCLRAYLEESVAQRVRRGLVKAQAIWLDCYVNGVSRRETIARAWHGTKHWAVKAFRRNIAQDVDTGQAVTCPLSRSDVTPLQVLQQVVEIINGGLERAGVAYRLGRVIADRWWSVAEVLAYCLDEKLGFLCWAKAVKNVLEALDAIYEKDPNWQPLKEQVVNPDSGQVEEKVVGYRLETELTIYELSKPVRAIVDWDGQPRGRKVARLAVGVTEASLGTAGVCNELRFRQRVEILLKFLQRWLQLPNFGGGEAVARPDERVCPGDEELKKLETEYKKTATRLRNAESRQEEVEAELEHLEADKKHQPRNSLGLGVQDLRSLSKRLREQIERAKAKLQELQVMIAWGKGQGPEQETECELDLTRETILAQLKLDVFTAYQTLVDEFIELALKPVLREEAERQAAERRRLDKRSTAKGREGEPLSTDVETLYQTKVANLERETILKRLLNQPGRHLYHRGERILITVAQRFSDRRMQAAYERYCAIINRRHIRVPLDDGEEWLLLFTYEKPPSPATNSNDALQC
jgi:hypothetical protein